MNLNWCEEDFAINPHIAEYTNTWTSLCFVYIGNLGLYMHDHVPLVKRASFFILLLIGASSARFHARLDTASRLMDEHSIALLVMYFQAHILHMPHRWIALYVVVQGLVGWFFANYNCVFLIACAVASYVALMRRIAYSGSSTSLRKHQEHTRLGTELGVMFAASVLVWCMDFHWSCHYVQWHAVWHCMSAVCGFWLCTLFTCYEDPTVVVDYIGGVVPRCRSIKIYSEHTY